MLAPLVDRVVEHRDGPYLIFLHHLLQSQQMPIDALGRTGSLGGLDMLLGCLLEQSLALAPRGVGVEHGFDKGIRLGRDGPDDLRSSLVELASGRGLVSTALTLLTERVEETGVGELNDHLGPGIWGGLEFLDGCFPVFSEVERHGLGVDELESGSGRIFDGLLRLGGNVEVEGHRNNG